MYRKDEKSPGVGQFSKRLHLNSLGGGGQVAVFVTCCKDEKKKRPGMAHLKNLKFGGKRILP